LMHNCNCRTAMTVIMPEELNSSHSDYGLLTAPKQDLDGRIWTIARTVVVRLMIIQGTDWEQNSSYRDKINGSAVLQTV
jgi:hypothetical protein